MDITNRKKLNEILDGFINTCEKEGISLTLHCQENIPKRIEKNLCEILGILFPMGIQKCKSCCVKDKKIELKIKIIQNQLFIKFIFSWKLNQDSKIKNIKKLKGLLIVLDGYYKFFREEERYCIHLAYSIRKTHP